MNEAQIVIAETTGYHNKDIQATVKRIERSKSYQDLSTVCIVPTLDSIAAKVVQSWMGLLSPMNQKFTRIFVLNLEVGHAYSQSIEMILNHPELSKWKYILTLEHDNMPPPDGLLNLYEHMDKYDAIGGLYFTKGHAGQPMCYGQPNIFPVNFIPFMPPPDSIQECRGLGMGFTLFKMDMFKDPRLPRPFFQTVQRYREGIGTEAYTQDLKFFENAGKLGYRFACNSGVRVGHFEVAADFVW